MPLYIDNSTFFGSTKTSFTSSGLAFIKIETIISFIQTDLPEPVAPATKRCGVLSISHHFTLPIISFPSPTASTAELVCLGIASSVSLKVTIWGASLGISIPTVLFPGIGAWILISFFASASDISLFIVKSFDTLVPDDRESSYWVTVGPIFTSTTFPLIPKSFKTCSKTEIFFSIKAWSVPFLFFFPISSKSIGGSV